MNTKQKLKKAIEAQDLSAISRELHTLTQVMHYSEEHLFMLLKRDCGLNWRAAEGLLAAVRLWELFGDQIS